MEAATVSVRIPWLRSRSSANGEKPSPSSVGDRLHATHVAIIGAGRGGTALMEIFANDPLVRIVGVAEINPQAPGLGPRQTVAHPRDARLSAARCVWNGLIWSLMCRAISEVGNYLQDFHRMGVTVIGGASAKFMWQLIEARIRATAEIEKTLNQVSIALSIVCERNRSGRHGRTDADRLRNS